MKPLAVVTGASTGIGLELAKQFARNEFDVVLAASSEKLEQARAEVTALGAEVLAVRVDLATHDGVEQLVKQVKAGGRPVDALALNAGIGMGGDFARETSLAQELEIIDLNCRSTVHLAKRLLPGMIAHGRGRILITSSIAATMPGAYHAVYNASKSFTQSFALALREELKDSGITVTSLMPGPTDTEFFERADMLDTRVGSSDKDDAELVARQGFDAMMSGEERVVAGSLANKLQDKAGRFVPDRLKAKMHARMAEPGSGDGDDAA